MRKSRAFGRLFVFPAACLACVVWVTAFILVGIRMPNPNLGLVLMLVFTGLGLLLPWLVVAIAMAWRMGGNDDTASAPGVPPPKGTANA